MSSGCWLCSNCLFLCVHSYMCTQAPFAAEYVDMCSIISAEATRLSNEEDKAGESSSDSETSSDSCCSNGSSLSVERRGREEHTPKFIKRAMCHFIRLYNESLSSSVGPMNSGGEDEVASDDSCTDTESECNEEKHDNNNVKNVREISISDAAAELAQASCVLLSLHQQQDQLYRQQSAASQKRRGSVAKSRSRKRRESPPPEVQWAATLENFFQALHTIQFCLPNLPVALPPLVIATPTSLNIPSGHELRELIAALSRASACVGPCQQWGKVVGGVGPDSLLITRWWEAAELWYTLMRVPLCSVTMKLLISA
jgi:hypothetical protein